MATSSSLSASLLKHYQEFLDKAAGVVSEYYDDYQGLPSALNIGVVGGGMSGLYSTLLLQHHIPGVNVSVFEADNRVGGSVYTYKFSPEPHQYFEAGAMRIPDIESHRPVFTLIDYLNKQFPENSLDLIDFK